MKVLIFLLCVVALNVQAQVYKWTDASGRTQYSDQPPPAAKGKAKTLNLKETQMTTLPGAVKSSAVATASASNPAQAASAPVAGKPVKDEQACAAAEKRLSYLRSANLYKNVSNDTGKVEFLEAKQKQKEIEEKSAFIEKNCR